MRTTAKRLLTALAIGTVIFAVGVSSTAGAATMKALDAEEQAFWDKFRDSVMKDKPAPTESPRVADRKPVAPPKEAESPREVDRQTGSILKSAFNDIEEYELILTSTDGSRDRPKDRASGTGSNTGVRGEVETRNPSGVKVKMPEAKAPKPVPNSPSPPYLPVQPPYLPPQPPYAQ